MLGGGFLLRYKLRAIRPEQAMQTCWISLAFSPFWVVASSKQLWMGGIDAPMFCSCLQSWTKVGHKSVSSATRQKKRQKSCWIRMRSLKQIRTRASIPTLSTTIPVFVPQIARVMSVFHTFVEQQNSQFPWIKPGGIMHNLLSTDIPHESVVLIFKRYVHFANGKCCSKTPRWLGCGQEGRQIVSIQSVLGSDCSEWKFAHESDEETRLFSNHADDAVIYDKSDVFYGWLIFWCAIFSVSGIREVWHPWKTGARNLRPICCKRNYLHELMDYFHQHEKIQKLIIIQI